MNPRALIAILLLSGLTYAGYDFWQQRKQDEEANRVVTPLSSALGKEVPLITIERMHRDDPSGPTVLDYDTPKVKILSDHTAADRANAYIARFVEDAVGRFSSELKRGTVTASTSASMINTFTMNAKVLLTTPRIITIAFTESTMLAQIPHPQKFVRYITFDLMHAKVIESKDLFIGTDTMTRIATQISKLESAKALSPTQINQSLLRDDQHALNKNGLLISVDTEEDPTTRTRTSVEFVLPFSSVNQYINPDIRNAILTEQDNIRMAEPETGS
ncbi:MAG TPA: hypothetical protein VJ579_00600 [Candidatus Paceibacterota bacterium]|nr:hypothetical protein [Candidatus Paceibacterota bacterium]